MRVMPESSAAWMVAMERDSSGRLSIDIGMPPSPRALTLMSPIWRICTGVLLVGVVRWAVVWWWVSAGGEGRKVRCGLLRGAVRAQDVEYVDQVAHVDPPIDGGAARPVLQVSGRCGDREAAGVLHGQALGIAHRGSSGGGGEVTSTIAHKDLD